MKNQIKKIIFLILLITFPASSKGVHIVFDLGDVLVETNHAKALWHIGPLRLFYYLSTWKNPLGCHGTLYNFLHELKDAHPDEIKAKDHHGTILPQLMCDWLKGDSPHKILEDIKDALQNQITSYAYGPDQIIIKAVAELIFDPKKFAKTTKLIEEGLEFVKECKELGHHCYILSNWDAYSMNYLKALYPKFFNLFNRVIISGEIGLIKPDPDIYRHFLKETGLQPHECIFIDDQHDNVDAAKMVGFHAIRYSKKPTLFGTMHNFNPIRRELKKFSI